MVRIFKEKGKYCVERDGKVKRFDNLADAWEYAWKFRDKAVEKAVLEIRGANDER